MTLTQLETICVPQPIVHETEGHLRRAGRRGLELFVLWSGTLSTSEFTVRTVHVPRQTSYRMKSGLMVRVEGDALHGLNSWLYEHREVLAVQVHAHPTNAFHSETDNTYPIVTATGSISIVAADFCRDGLISGASAVYRLGENGWDQLDPPFAMFRVT